MNLPALDLNGVFKLDAKQQEILHKCEMELQRTAVKFNQYHLLYQTPSSYETLNESATTFFALIQQSLTTDILQSLARLYDPKTTGRAPKQNENCSLYWLAGNLPQPVGDTVQKALDSGRGKRTALETWRNKIGSHTDYSHAVKIVPAPEVSVAETGELIKETGQLLNYIRAQSEGPHYECVDYDPPVIEGAKELIAMLKDGIAYRRQQKAKRS
jgi:AbiU2